MNVPHVSHIERVLTIIRVPGANITNVMENDMIAKELRGTIKRLERENEQLQKRIKELEEENEHLRAFTEDRINEYINKEK